MSYSYSDELFSDLHKDAYGFRPTFDSWNAWLAMTPEQKQALWDRMVKDVVSDSD